MIIWRLSDDKDLILRNVQFSCTEAVALYSVYSNCTVSVQWDSAPATRHWDLFLHTSVVNSSSPCLLLNKSWIIKNQTLSLKVIKIKSEDRMWCEKLQMKSFLDMFALLCDMASQQGNWATAFPSYHFIRLKTWVVSLCFHFQMFDMRC